MEASKKKMTRSVMPRYVWFLIFTISLSALITGSAGDDSLQGECSSEFTKVTPCLGFVSGKAAKPTADCCSAVKGLRESKPVCLCYFIEQMQNGTAAKGLGIQVDKLLQLPSSCQLANASVSDCPKLLNISSSSPYYNIFTNASATAGPPSTSTGTSSAADSSSSSLADKHAPSLAGAAAAIAAAIFFLALPAGQCLHQGGGEGFCFGSS